MSRVSNIKIPLKERWLFKNKAVLVQVKKGLDDSHQGKVKFKGKFASCNVIPDKCCIANIDPGRK